MSSVTVKDNTRIERAKLEPVGTLAERIADKPLGMLQDVFIYPQSAGSAEDLEDGQTILKSEKDGYRTGNVMGLIGLEGERLVIRSRFGGEGEDYFFAYLLCRALGLPNVVRFAGDMTREDGVLNLAVFLFPRCLKAAVRKGIYKEYIALRRNDANVKGSIDTARHIRKNTPFTGKIAYTQREFSPDNSLMQLVRHTIEFIKSRPYGSALLFEARGETALVTGATPDYRAGDRRRIIGENRKHPVHHAYYREYRTLQRLCLMILQGAAYRAGTGSKRIYGVLFDGAWLWEEYIAGLTGKLFYHPQNRSRTGAEYLFGGKKGEIYPDFIGRDAANRIIADAKYKPKENIAGGDYLQLLAYMLRFEAKTGCYLYPESGAAESKRLRLNRGTEYERNAAARDDICVIKHGLKIPAGMESGEAFAEAMRENERAFLRALAGG